MSFGNNKLRICDMFLAGIFLLVVKCQLSLSTENVDTTLMTSSTSATVTASSELRDPAQVHDAANTMFQEYWQIVLKDNPEAATQFGDHRYDDRLTSYSLKCYEKRKVVMNEFLERANQMLPLAEEGSDTHFNLELFITNLQNQLDLLMSGDYLFPFSIMHTPQMSLRYLLKYIVLNNSQDYWSLISRYRAIPEQIDEQIELMREGIRTNFTLNEHSMFFDWKDTNQSIEESPFYKPFRNISSFIPQEEIFAIQANASDAVKNFIVPAYDKMSEFIEKEYREHLRPGVGVSSLPNGREFYRQQLAYHLTDSKITPEEIHQMGLSEVERISRQMDEVIHSLKLNMNREEFSDQLRHDEVNFFDSEEEALETYRDMLEKVITPKLSQLFKVIPQKKLTVEKIPLEMATGPRAYYMHASPDGATPATFFLDTSSLKNLPKYEVVTLALHEGVPGHHFQLSHSMENNNVPEFRKYDIKSNAFVEGWALYAEYLGQEMNLYGDPKMRYGHLSEEIFRASRMVVDTGMHVFGWSRQKAIDYMMNNTASTLNNVEREIDRYISWPGQACSYKFGEMKIKELRLKAQEELGSDFDIKDFHEVVLQNYGPIDLLEKQVKKYIASTLGRRKQI